MPPAGRSSMTGRPAQRSEHTPRIAAMIASRKLLNDMCHGAAASGIAASEQPTINERAHDNRHFLVIAGNFYRFLFARSNNIAKTLLGLTGGKTLHDTDLSDTQRTCNFYTPKGVGTRMALFKGQAFMQRSWRKILACPSQAAYKRKMKQNQKRKTAAILAIGDELLSGRTRDANIHYLSGWLNERAVALVEARIVADDMASIGEALNALRARYDYVFTSGGIGPTHDDITVDAIARAFNVPVVEHPQAIKMIEAWYSARDQEVTPARRRMARTPQGAVLIDNPVSGAPGVRIANVFVMAGVPRIFQGMLNAIEGEIERGVQMYSRAATALKLPESQLADQLREIQSALKGVALGSYPIDGDEFGVTVIARAEEESVAEAAITAVAAAMRALGVEPTLTDRR